MNFFYDKNTIVLKGKVSILAHVSLFGFGILS